MYMILAHLKLESLIQNKYDYEVLAVNKFPTELNEYNGNVGP